MTKESKRQRHQRLEAEWDRVMLEDCNVWYERLSASLGISVERYREIGRPLFDTCHTLYSRGTNLLDVLKTNVELGDGRETNVMSHFPWAAQMTHPIWRRWNDIERLKPKETLLMRASAASRLNGQKSLVVVPARPSLEVTRHEASTSHFLKALAIVDHDWRKSLPEALIRASSRDLLDAEVVSERSEATHALHLVGECGADHNDPMQTLVGFVFDVEGLSRPLVESATKPALCDDGWGDLDVDPEGIASPDP